MPPSNSRLSYKDCFELYDKALADNVGSRIRARDQSHAIHVRSRLHYARKLDREANRETYEPGDPLYGRSTYDPIIISCTKDSRGQWWIVMRKTDALNYEVESLDGLDESLDSDNGETAREEAKVGAVQSLGERRRA